MRIAVFTDVHHHSSNVALRHCSHAIPSLRSIFSRFANPDEKPDMIVTLGDLIMAARHEPLPQRQEADRKYLGEILSCFAESGIGHVHHLHGNHEDKNLDRQEVADIAARHGADLSSRVVEQGGLSLVFWSPYVRIAGGVPDLTENDFEWLSSALDNVTGPALVLTHLPLDGDLSNFTCSQVDQRPSPVFGHKKQAGNRRSSTHHANADRARDIIAASGKVMACLAGHTHWNEARQVDNVAYITLPSLVENADGRPHDGWAMMDFDSHSAALRIDVRGASPCEYALRPGEMRIGRPVLNPL